MKEIFINLKGFLARSWRDRWKQHILGNYLQLWDNNYNI